MKIVYVTDSFAPESVGGAGQVALDMALGMMAEGHTVHVVTATQRRESAGDAEYAGISVHRIYSPTRSQLARSYLSVYNPFIRSASISLLKKLQPDVVHAHNVHEHFSFALIRWVRSIGVPCFITLHDTLSFAYTRLYHFIDSTNKDVRAEYNFFVPTFFTMRQVGKAYNPIRKWCIRRSLRMANGVFSVSEALNEALRQNGIAYAETFYNGVDVREFQASVEDVNVLRQKLDLGDHPIILFGGRAMQDKGTEVLIDALPEIVSHSPGVLVVMAIEPGSYRDSVLRYARRRGVEGSLRCIDLLHGRDRAALFSVATIVAVPSIYLDPAPLMAMQAMAAGKPVIGTCFGGTPEIVLHDVTGVIVNPFDTESVSLQISRLLQSPELCHAMGLAGLRRIELSFSVAQQTRAMIKRYQSMLLRCDK